MTKHEFDKLKENASPATRKAMEEANGESPPTVPVTEKPSIRVPKPRKMSGPEAEYQVLLRKEFTPGIYAIRYEEMTFRLHSGALYCADFTVWTLATLVLVVETKGPFRLQSARGSYLAFKSAIAEWPHVVFRFAEKKESGNWAVQNYNR